MSLFRFDAMGVPLVSNDNLIYANVRHVNDNQIVITTLITSMVFLFVIVWFTYVFNLSTRERNNTDYYFLQFAIYFSIVAFIVVYILLHIKSNY